MPPMPRAAALQASGLGAAEEVAIAMPMLQAPQALLSEEQGQLRQLSAKQQPAAATAALHFTSSRL